MSIVSWYKIFSLITECACVCQKTSVNLSEVFNLHLINDPFFFSCLIHHLYFKPLPSPLRKCKTLYSTKISHAPISQGLGISDSHFAHIHLPSGITVLPLNLHPPLADRYDVFFLLYVFHTQIHFQVSPNPSSFPLFCLSGVYLFLLYVLILNYEFISKLISFP